MGKIRETFRLIADELPLTAPAVAAEPDLPAPDPVEEERSFIEIGPRRQIEASPDVLACPAPKRPLGPPARGVAFRTLPGAAGPARRSPFAPELVAFHAPDQPAASQYATLLEAVVESARGRSARADNVFLFCGARRGAGTTTVLLNLAITAARQGKRVVVVDADLRKAAVAGRVGLGAHPGLTDVLNGDVALAEAVRPTAQENLSVLASGTPTALWADTGSLAELFENLSGQAGLVLIDGPPWDGRGATAGLAAVTAAVFLAVPAREADSPPATELVETLPARGVPLAGCILTEV